MTLEAQIKWRKVENSKLLQLDKVALLLRLALPEKEYKGAWYVGDGWGITEELRHKFSREPSDRVLMINTGNDALEEPFAAVISYRALQSRDYRAEQPTEFSVSGVDVSEEVVRALAAQLQ